MTVIVVDASVLAPALGDDGSDGARARQRLFTSTLAAPALVDLEVMSVLRKLVIREKLSTSRAAAALESLSRLPMTRVDHGALLFRCWELRSNITPYDAAYIALAELMQATLVTADARLAKAPGVRCDVELLGA